MVEQALEALFTGPVETFIAERDRLAKELKAAGDKDGAAQVKGQHKPTLVAHALNTLVRAERPAIDELLALGGTLASGKGDFHAALEKQRALLQGLAQKAAALAGNDGPAIVSVLQGAMASPELAAQVRTARFSKLPEVPVGFFGVPGPGAPAIAPATEARPAAAAARISGAEMKPPAERENAEQAEHDRAEAERQAKHAAEVQAAEKAAEQARVDADVKGQRAEALEKAARDASVAAAAAKHEHLTAVQHAKELAERARKARLRPV
jgi:hypothetical protein